jgi:hypothetical protein
MNVKENSYFLYEITKVNKQRTRLEKCAAQTMLDNVQHNFGLIKDSHVRSTKMWLIHISQMCSLRFACFTSYDIHALRMQTCSSTAQYAVKYDILLLLHCALTIPRYLPNRLAK